MKCDMIAAGVIAAAKEVGLKVPLVVRLEGTNVELGKKMLAESGLDITAAADMADGAQKVVEAAGGHRSEHPRRTRTPARRPGHHRLGGRVPRQADGRVRHARSSPASRPARAARRSRARADPDVRHRRRGGAAAPARTRRVIYVPPPFAADAILEAAAAGIAADRRDHRGHPGARHGARSSTCSSATPGRRADRPELPGRDHAGPVQDRHHAGLHPQAGRRRRRVALRHADLRGRRPAHRARPRPVDRDRHRRRSGEGHRLHRRARAVRRGSGHDGDHHDRRDRRRRRGARGRSSSRST